MAPLTAQVSLKENPIQVEDVPPLSPQESAGFFSSVLWSWMTPLMDLGVQRPLEFEDMHHVPSFVRSKQAASAFESAWSDELDAIKSAPPGADGVPQTPSIYRSLKSIYLGRFLWASLSKLVADVLSLVSPQFMSLLIVFIQQSRGASPPDIGVGIALAAAMFLSAFFQAVTTNSYMNIVSTHTWFRVWCGGGLVKEMAWVARRSLTWEGRTEEVGIAMCLTNTGHEIEIEIM
jgi:hypothetical protein